MGANLKAAVGLITIPTSGPWSIAVGVDMTKIGCQKHSNKDWENFTDEQIARMHYYSLSFWRCLKPVWQEAVKECQRMYGEVR